MYPGQVLDDLDEVLHLRVRLHAAAVGDLEPLHHLGHFVAPQVQEGLDQVTVDETLEKKIARCYNGNLFTVVFLVRLIKSTSYGKGKSFSQKSSILLTSMGSVFLSL